MGQSCAQVEGENNVLCFLKIFLFVSVEKQRPVFLFERLKQKPSVFAKTIEKVPRQGFSRLKPINVESIRRLFQSVKHNMLPSERFFFSEYIRQN